MPFIQRFSASCTASNKEIIRMKVSEYITVIVVLLAGLFLINPASSAGESVNGKEPVVVKIVNVAFSPEEIHIKPGTTVRWINLDPLLHDVTSGKAITGRRARQVDKTRFPDGIFHSGTFGKDGVFEFTYTRKGKYYYFCNVHPIMHGVVVVE